MVLTIYNQAGEKLDTMNLPGILENLELNAELVQRAVVYNMRARKNFRFASTKNISQVSGTGKKPFKQKGTGNARQGTLRGPHFRGGAIVFGPTPHNITYSFNKKAWRKALLMALRDKIDNNKILLLDSLELSSHKTKELEKILANLKVSDALLVSNGVDKNSNIYKASSNLVDIKLIPDFALNILDLLTYTNLIIEKNVLDKILNRLGN